jgi:hypothetical protein
MIPSHIHFTLFITFPTLFLKLLDLEKRDPKHLQVAGSRAGWSYLQSNIYRYVFCFLLEVISQKWTNADILDVVLC